MHLQKSNGQSLIEYTIIAVLVILGIVFMGPYLVRSVNAHFKMWDDQVQDSYNDRLTQVPAENVHLPAGCQCLDKDVQGQCGYIRAKTVTCQENERYYHKICDPSTNCSPSCAIACSMIEGCEPDLSCCTAEKRSNMCGSIPRTDPRPPDCVTNKDSTTGAVTYNCPPNMVQNCWYGERMIVHRCGNNGQETKIRCVPDTVERTDREGGQTHFDVDCQDVRDPATGIVSRQCTNIDDDDADCSAMCQGSIPTKFDGTPGAQFCPNSNRDVPQDMRLRFIGGASQCPAQDDLAHKCVAFCLPPFVPTADGTSCTRCGNGKCEWTENGYRESCDGANGAIRCVEDCGNKITAYQSYNNPPIPKSCGNGTYYANDQADNICLYLGFDKATWYSTSGFSSCGDNNLVYYSSGEINNPNSWSCKNAENGGCSNVQGLTCASEHCPTCGNGKIDAGESCDGGWTKGQNQNCTYVPGNIEGCRPNGKIDVAYRSYEGQENKTPCLTQGACITNY